MVNRSTPRLPSGWEVKKLGEVAQVTMGQSPLSINYNTDGAGLPLLQGNADIKKRNAIVRVFTTQITKKASTGDILLSVRAPVGEVSKTSFNACLGRGLCAIKYLNGYLYQYLIYKESGWRQLSKGSTFDSVTSKDVRDFEIVRPESNQEQIAISNALEIIDNHIDATEQRLNKSFLIKQALMHDLLTGRRRLPGFSDPWLTKKLEDIAEMNSGGTPRSSVSAYYGGDIPWVSISDMTRQGRLILETERALTASGLASSSAQLYPPNTVLYAMYASIGECAIAPMSVSSSQAILGIRPKPQLNHSFLYYYLSSIKEDVKKMGQQGTQSNLNAGMVKAFRIPLPSLTEQLAIVSALESIDQELNVFQGLHRKHVNIKQALMHELLTGKTRLL